MSPNLTLSDSVLDLSAYQLTSGKGVASGYASLSASTLMLPTEMLPGFAGASNGAFWVKSGSALAVQSSTTFDASGLIGNQVRVGTISGSLYGIDQQRSNTPLILHAHSGSGRVYVYNGQTLGGADSAHTAFLWSIGPTGTFSLAGGTFGAAVNLGGFATTNALSIAGSTLTINFATGATTGTLNLNGSAVTVADAKTGSSDDRPVNRDTGDTLYGRLASANLWTVANTFTLEPTFTAGIAQAQITGLVNALTGKLSTSGGTMSGAIAMGTSKITGVGNPTAGSQEAATANYVDGLTSASTGGTLSVLVATSPLVRNMASNITTLSIPAATASVAGHLTVTDWIRFNAASASTEAQIANTVQAGPTSGGDAIPTFRQMVRADLIPFLSGSASLTFTTVADHSYQDQTISIPGATAGSPCFPGLPATTPGTFAFDALCLVTDVVTIRAHNQTAGALTISAATYRATVLN